MSRVGALGLLAVIGGVAACSAPADRTPPPGDDRSASLDEGGARVRAACQSCHQFPPPDILPRAMWEDRIVEMYELAEARDVPMPLPVDSAFSWYASRAPAELPPAPGRTDAGPGPVALRVADWRPPPAPPPSAIGPGTTHVRFADLLDDPGPELIVSDARHDLVYTIEPATLAQGPLLSDEVRQPGRVEVVDLDVDGRDDLVVASLGEFMPTNERVGSLVWLRRGAGSSFETRVLMDGLGRVADVRAADLTDDGRPDLVVAIFGWRENGEVTWLENGVGEDGDVRLVPHTLDSRPGAIDVRVVDLDGDGRLDIATLMSQEFQEVVVHWGRENGFRSETVYRAPHPAWGFSGMEVVDFTGDGRPDIVVTNGDSLDRHLVRPDHGVGFLENAGDRTFRYRHLTNMYGAFRAVPVDLVGDGRMGLVISAHLLPFMVADLEPEPPEALLWLERVGPTQLVRRVLKRARPYHLSLDVADFTADGRTDFAVAWVDFARFVSSAPETLEDWEPVAPWVSLWRNEGVSGPPTDPATVEVIDWSR